MLPCGTFNQKYGEDVAIVRTRLQWGLMVVFFVLLFCLPFFPGVRSGLLSWVIMASITLIAVLGLHILTGYCGQISLGQAAFMLLGGFASGLSMTFLHLPFLLAVVLGGLVAAVAGLLFGLPAARIKGFYLAMSTIAAHFIIIYILTHIPKNIGGGSEGRAVPLAQIGGIVLDSDFSFYFVAVAFALILGLMAHNLGRTKAGRAFVAIRDNDIAAEMLGINITAYKLLAFGVCAFYAGISGALLTHYLGYIMPEHYTLMASVWYLGMLIVGGMGSTMGAIYGVVSLKALEELALRFGPAFSEVIGPRLEGLSASLAMLAYALVIILFLIFEPRGINHRWQILKSWYRFWPFSY